MLYLDVAVGDTISIDSGRVLVRIERKTGPKARVRIEADRSIPVEVKNGRADPRARGLTVTRISSGRAQERQPTATTERMSARGKQQR